MSRWKRWTTQACLGDQKCLFLRPHQLKYCTLGLILISCCKYQNSHAFASVKFYVNFFWLTRVITQYYGALIFRWCPVSKLFVVYGETMVTTLDDAVVMNSWMRSSTPEWISGVFWIGLFVRKWLGNLRSGDALLKWDLYCALECLNWVDLLIQHAYRSKNLLRLGMTAFISKGRHKKLAIVFHVLQPLFCSWNLLFSDVLVCIAVVVCQSSPLNGRRRVLLATCLTAFRVVSSKL